MSLRPVRLLEVIVGSASFLIVVVSIDAEQKRSRGTQYAMEMDDIAGDVTGVSEIRLFSRPLVTPSVIT